MERMIIMDTWKEFLSYLVGNFDNRQQWEEKKSEDFPFAKHVNTLVTDKIQQLPEEKMAFLLEENTYLLQGKTKTSAHLFQFIPIDENKIKMYSYRLPKGTDGKVIKTVATFPTINYCELQKSPQFEEAIFERTDEGHWTTHSVSQTGKDRYFVLNECFTPNQLQVDEKIYAHEKLIFGFSEPILYDRKI